MFQAILASKTFNLGAMQFDILRNFSYRASGQDRDNQPKEGENDRIGV
jgi:hypothetical protein